MQKKWPVGHLLGDVEGVMPGVTRNPAPTESTRGPTRPLWSAGLPPAKSPSVPLRKGGSPPARGEGPPLECGLPARNGKPARAGGGVNRRGRPPCLPREALADRASTSAKYLSRIETGHENPTIDLLLRLADGLNVEPYEMLCFEEGELVRQLRTRAVKLIDEVPDKDLARVVGLLEAVLH